MKRRNFTHGVCGCLLTGGLTACVTHQSRPITGDVSPGYNPDITTDEAGLWLQVEKYEKEVRDSQIRLRDEAINALVHDITCNLASKHCRDTRAYVVRVPQFNATCYPSGMIQVYSGLLLRMHNEAQLAAVLGHEFAHYLKRHSLQKMRDIRDKSNFAVVLGMAGAAAGAPQLGSLTMDLLRLSVAAFSRDAEREADAVGLELMADAGYDPHEVPAVWKRIIAEQEASGEEREFDAFTDTHPSTDERVDTLAKAAEKRGRPREVRPNRLPAALAPIRGIMLADEIDRGRFKTTEKLFDMIFADGHNQGEVLYYKGELYRRRGKNNDEVMALGFYHEACELPGAPPAAFRQVGLMRWRRRENEVAREYFRRYLHVAPDAPDREMIKKYIGGA